MLLTYEFSDMLDLSVSDHYQLQQIMDNQSMQEDSEEDYQDFFSISVDM